MSGIVGFFFDRESIFGKFMGKLSMLIVTNLMFIICCIPIVTIGASVTALYHVCLKSLRVKGEISYVKEFWRGFVSNFKQATTCWLGVIAFYSFCLMEIYWCRQFSGMFVYVGLAILAICCMVAVVIMFFFPTLAAFENSTKILLKNAVYFCTSRPLRALGIFLCNVLPLAVTYLDETNRPTYVFIWFFIGFSLIAWVCAHLLIMEFTKYLPSVECQADESRC